MALAQLIALRMELEEIYRTSRLKVSLADYQLKLSSKIFKACLAGGNNEIPLLWARRSGKTEMLVQTAIVLGIYWIKVLHQGYSIGLINPARDEQGVAVTRDRIKDRLEVIDAWLKANNISEFLDKGRKTEDYVLRDDDSGAECRIRCISAHGTAHVKGAGFNLSILEQVEEMDEVKMKTEIFEMATGAEMESTRILAGTCSLEVTNQYYYDHTENLEYPEFVDWKTAGKYRPSYGLWAQEEGARIRFDSDAFRTQFGCEWITPRTRLINRDELIALAIPYVPNVENKRYAGTDVAKDVDSTVVTVLERTGANLTIIDWLELQGVDYEDQADKIVAFTASYNVVMNTVDTRGPGNVLIDMLRRRGATPVQGIQETPQLNNTLYVEYEREITQKRLRYIAASDKEPAERTRCRDRFFEQHTDVRRIVKNNLVSLKAPERTDAHDDYCSSAALAVYGTTHPREVDLDKLGSWKI